MNFSHRPRGRARALGTTLSGALLASLLVTGCGSDDPDPGAGESSAAAPTSGSASTDPTDTTSGSPEVEPASGPALTLGKLSVHLPDGWKEGSSLGKLQVSADSDRPGTYLFLIQIAVLDDGAGLTAQAQEAIDGLSNLKGKATVEAITTIGGEPAYHVSGTEKGGDEVDQFGLVLDGRAYTVNFNRLPERSDLSDEEWADLMASVVASAEWK